MPEVKLRDGLFNVLQQLNEYNETAYFQFDLLASLDDRHGVGVVFIHRVFRSVVASDRQIDGLGSSLSRETVEEICK